MRPVRLVTPALVIIVSLLAATGCSAGQVAQTATQVITQEGANAERGGVAVRGALIPTPLRGAYKTGEQAPLYLAIATEEGAGDTLVTVTSEAAASVVLIRSPFDAAGSAAATPTPSAGSGGTELVIGSGTLILLTQGMSYLQLQALTDDLTPGDTVSVTFSFARAGEITLDVPVATPDTPGPRLKPTEGSEPG